MASIATAAQGASKGGTWADLSGRWFLAWRMAAACEGALQELHQAMDGQREPKRALALKRVSTLLQRELMHWVRRGEALDMIVEHLPRRREQTTSPRP